MAEETLHGAEASSPVHEPRRCSRFPGVFTSSRRDGGIRTYHNFFSCSSKVGHLNNVHAKVKSQLYHQFHNN